MLGGRRGIAMSITVAALGLTGAVVSAAVVRTEEVSAAPQTPTVVTTDTRVTATPPATATPVPTGPPNTLTSADGTLDTSVGVYTDCTGKTELTHAEAAVDSCVSGATYFVGHNPGVFTPLMTMGVGSLITYDDANGMAHTWRVVSVRTAWHSAGGIPPVTESDVVAQFQTCVLPDGSIDRILDVVPA